MQSGISFGSGVFMWDDHGQMKPVEVAEFTETTLEEAPPECGHYIPDSWWHDEICGTFNMSRPHFRAFQRIAWGWRAKGPIRKRVLKSLWKGGEEV